MNKHLHNSDEIFGSAQHGWEQMKLLLDVNLPVANRKNNKQLYRPSFIAAAITTLLLFSSIVLQNGSHSNFYGKGPSISLSNQPAVSKNNAAVNKNDPATNITIYAAGGRNSAKRNTMPSGTFPLNLAGRKLSSGNDVQSNTDFLELKESTVPATIETVWKQASEDVDTGNKMVDLRDEVVVKDAARPYSASQKIATKKGIFKNNWNLFAGIALNAIIDERQNPQPFPVAEVRFNISSRFFLSLGLSAISPVAKDSRGITKTVYVNDTVNNVQLYNNVSTYRRLCYADVPLTAGVSISKRLAVLGGLQASVLLSAKNKISVESYDFQMRLAGASQNNLVSLMAPASENNYRISAGKIDYRLVSGVRYSANKTSFSLLYQHSLLPVFKGNYVSADKNHLLTLKALYRIK